MNESTDAQMKAFWDQVMAKVKAADSTTTANENFKNQMKALRSKDVQQFWDELLDKLKASVATVVTTYYDDGKTKGNYVTTIEAFTWSVTTTYPPNHQPTENEYIWKIHKELYDKEIDMKKEITEKIIDMVVDLVKGLFNPITL